MSILRTLLLLLMNLYTSCLGKKGLSVELALLIEILGHYLPNEEAIQLVSRRESNSPVGRALMATANLMNRISQIQLTI